MSIDRGLGGHPDETDFDIFGDIEEIVEEKSSANLIKFERNPSKSDVLFNASEPPPDSVYQNANERVSGLFSQENIEDPLFDQLFAELEVKPGAEEPSQTHPTSHNDKLFEIRESPVARGIPNFTKVHTPSSRDDIPDFGSLRLAIDEELAKEAEVKANRSDSLENTLSPVQRDKRFTTLPIVSADNKDRPVFTNEEKVRFDVKDNLGKETSGYLTVLYDRELNYSIVRKTFNIQDPTPVQLANFVQEIRILKALAHPNIPNVIDAGISDEGKYYYNRTKPQGETLLRIIAQLRIGDPHYHMRFPYATRVRIFLEVIRAIHCAHKQDLIHRDLKPEKIYIGSQGEVTVVGWENARKAEGSQELPFLDLFSGEITEEPEEPPNEEIFFYPEDSDKFFGTSSYRSPEQARNNAARVNKQSDLYTLSAIFYEFLSLRHYLHQHLSIEANQGLLSSIIREKPLPPSALDHSFQARIPEQLSEYCMKGLEKSTAKRFASTDEMLEELQGILTQQFVPEEVEEATKNPVKTMLLLVFGLLFFVTGSYQIFTWIMLLF